MCARFNLASPEQAARYFQGRLRFDDPPRYNIAPTDLILTGLLDAGGLVAEHMRWGMKLGDRPGVINLRSETSSIERSFGSEPRFQRCLIPATGFFEWRQEGSVKQPYNFVMESGEAFAFAGLWQPGHQGPPEVAILTCHPNELVAAYHDRMPSLVAPEDAERYLSGSAEEVLEIARVPFPAERMKTYPVSRKMGSPRFQDSEAIRPAEPPNPSLF